MCIAETTQTAARNQSGQIGAVGAISCLQTQCIYQPGKETFENVISAIGR